MRDGRPGLGPLDQALDLVHSLAEAAARAHDPFGCALVDGRVVDRRPVLEGLSSLRDVDHALLDIRRAVAEDLEVLRRAVFGRSRIRQRIQEAQAVRRLLRHAVVNENAKVIHSEV